MKIEKINSNKMGAFLMGLAYIVDGLVMVLTLGQFQPNLVEIVSLKFSYPRI